MSDTPKTDAAFQWDSYGTKFVEASFARQLERELAEAKLQIAIAENEGYRRGQLHAAETINKIREQSRIVAVRGMRGDLNITYALAVLDTYVTPDGLTIDVQLPYAIANTSSPPEKG